MRNILRSGILVSAICLLAGVARADSIGTLMLSDCGGGNTGCPAATYSFDVGTTTASLSVTITGAVNTTNNFITAVDLGFTANSTGLVITNLSAPSAGWTQDAGPLSSGLRYCSACLRT